MPPFTGSRGGATAPIEIAPGDVEIGAVEIKDGSTDQRATVTGGGELLVTATDTIPVSLAAAIEVANDTGNALPTRETPAAVTIDNIADNDVSTAESIIAANADRKGFLVQNVEADGGEVARVTWDGSTPTATLGAQLRPGAALFMEAPFCGVGAVQAIAESGTVTLHVTEFD